MTVPPGKVELPLRPASEPKPTKAGHEYGHERGDALWQGQSKSRSYCLAAPSMNRLQKSENGRWPALIRPAGAVAIQLKKRAYYFCGQRDAFPPLNAPISGYSQTPLSQLPSTIPTSLGATTDEEYLKRFLPLKPTIRQRFTRGVRRLKKRIRVNVVEGVPRAVERMKGIEWATAPMVITTEAESFGGGEKNEGEEGNLKCDKKGTAAEGDDEEWMTAPTSVFYTFSDIPPDLFDPSRLSKRPQSELSAQTRLGDAITAPVGIPFSGKNDARNAGTRVGAHVFCLRAGSQRRPTSPAARTYTNGCLEAAPPAGGDVTHQQPLTGGDHLILYSTVANPPLKPIARAPYPVRIAHAPDELSTEPDWHTMEREGEPGRWGSWPYRRDSGRERLIGGEWFGASYVQLVEEFSLVRPHTTNTFWASQGMFSRPDLVHVTLDVSVEGWLETTLRRQEERWKDLRASVNIRPTTCLATGICPRPWTVPISNLSPRLDTPMDAFSEMLATLPLEDMFIFPPLLSLFRTTNPLWGGRGANHTPILSLSPLVGPQEALDAFGWRGSQELLDPRKMRGSADGADGADGQSTIGTLVACFTFPPLIFFRRVDEGPVDELAWSTVLVLDYKA
ncbi:hypothetical protein FA13DRAFT_1715702 [Coprinellus micaceus]|uniref:Uncharacterized protein n=1 Tax=Coprinellus micaceus TaxID=71717 RepID=A0A4Y7SLU4_COPMI|nr:hypothetical protein FA13DRAFT_1715702 [Coprinellus micaceus]